MQLEPLALFISLLGGVLPALIWLWFWLREDSHPEPRMRIITTFIGGMLAVLVVIPLQTFAKAHLEATPLLIVIAWALIEEVCKLVSAYITGLRTPDDDEPIDSVIYLLTAGLGFAAVENALYLLTPVVQGEVFNSIITGNLRFIGASLVHVVCSAFIGVFIALAFYKSKASKILHLVVGLAVAVGLHSVFNLFIMKATGGNTFIVFYAVWFAIILLVVFFEKIKTIHNN